MSGRNRRPPLVAERRTERAKPQPKRPGRPRRTRGRGGWAGAILRATGRVTFGLAFRLGLLAALIVGGATLYVYATLPPVAALLDGRARGSVTMLDRYGETFAWRGEQFGGMVTADEVAPALRQAVVATEDRRFYRHFGISPRGIAGAIRINLAEGRGPLEGNGGSTITQQVAKLVCLGEPYDPASGLTEAEYENDCRRTTLWRKIKEVPFALAMEAKYSKDEILTIYLNRAYLGAGARGFEAAAERYFDKSAADVSVPEAAMLAGLLVAPSYYAPTADLDRAQERANLVIGLMEREGYLTADEAEAARANPATLSEAAEARAGGYFADWVMNAGPSFLTSETTEDVEILTTLDPSIQTAAEEALEHVFATQVKEGSEAQAAIVVMSADGAVRAMVGGRKLRGVAGSFNRAIQANRQTGSAFKPFVYAAALDLGYRYDDVVVDEPITLNIPGSGAWSPENYTRRYLGPITLAEALAQSINTVAVRVSEAVGRENVRVVAQAFGLESDLAAGPALALGASESTLIDMTGAYAGILNGGTSVEPYGLVELRLQGEETPMIGQSGGLGERVISENAARQLIHMMEGVIDHGTGTRASLGTRPAAGKTGTTDALRDAWFVGFTADYVAGVWMGYDDNTPLSGVTGGGLPADIWRETMLRVHQGLPERPLPGLPPALERRAPPPPPGEVASAPRYDGGSSGAASGNVDPGRIIERTLFQVLNDIFAR